MEALVQSVTVKFQSAPFDCEWIAFDAFSDKLQYSVCLQQKTEVQPLRQALMTGPSDTSRW